MEKARNLQLDILKGIGIIFVIIGHNLENGSKPFLYIYSFHMPLFFFISGFLYKYDNYKIKNFFKKKFESLIIPYISFSIISIILYYMFKSQGLEVLKAFLFANRYLNTLVEFNSPLWYLPCLFLVELIYYILHKKIINNKLLFLLIVAISYLGYRIHDKEILFMTFHQAFFYLLFYYFGNLFRKFKDNITNGRFRIILFLFCLLVNLFILTNMYADLCSKFFIIEIVTALCGIYVYYFISCLMMSSKILTKYFGFWGANSLATLCIHIPVREYVLGVIIWGLLGTFYGGFGIRLINIIGTLLLCFPFIIFINNYKPQLIGKKSNS